LPARHLKWSNLWERLRVLSLLRRIERTGRLGQVANAIRLYSCAARPTAVRKVPAAPLSVAK